MCPVLFGLWCLMPLLTLFQSYCGGKFYWWREKTKKCSLMKNKGINATAHIQNILHGDTLYNIKKKK